ncbi:MAG TPA: hypothetical protein VGI95_16790 [Caulobacteraceae bacterium]|jgi:hypothetical protein
MDIPKYAKFEHERRHLVLTPPDLTGSKVRLIEDRYLDGGRLRLRRITHFDGAPPDLKLCKKYASADPVSGPIVNIYLSADEYAELVKLPGKPLRKRRYTVTHAGRGFGVNVFEGVLAGLVLVEVEAETAEAIRQVAFPPWADADVTGELFFTGGCLASVGAAELAARLDAYRRKQAEPA